MGTAVQGNQKDFEKALDKVNPDSTTHYNKKSPDDVSDNNNIINDEVKDCIGNLILGCRMAQENGAFELEDARVLANSIDYLIKNGFTK